MMRWIGMRGMKYKQYSIVIVNLDPTVGSEIQKTRLCLIISPNEMNYANVIVAPMTSRGKDYPTRVTLGEESFVAFEQIRTISVKRIVKTTKRHISKKQIETIKKVIKTMLVD